MNSPLLLPLPPLPPLPPHSPPTPPLPSALSRTPSLQFSSSGQLYQTITPTTNVHRRHTCLVRLHKKNGYTCSEICVKNGCTCKKHTGLDKQSPIFLSTYLLQAKITLQSAQLISYVSVRPVIEAIHNTLNIDTQTARIQKLADVFAHVFTIDILKRYLTEYFPSLKPKRKTVSDIAGYIATMYTHMYELETSSSQLKALRKIQYDWRKYYKDKRNKDRGPWPQVSSINKEDPITLEDLSEVDETTVWSYYDTKGHVYAFLANKLQHFIETNGPWNPYTREPFSSEDLARLQRTVRRLPTESFQIVWRNPQDAFADVLHSYERYGFYTNIEWFLQLTPSDIIHIYQHMREDPYVPMYMFTYQLLEDRILENPDEGAHMALAKDMKYLMESNHTMKFYLVCNVFVALAQVCPTLRTTLPQWTILGASGMQQ